MTNLCVIMNPVAGRKQGPKLLHALRDKLVSTDFRLNVFETEFGGHAHDLARQMDVDAYDGIIVIGGDGTIHEVVNGLMVQSDRKPLPIGLMPGGSGNSLVRELGLLDPNDAVQAIVSGRTRSIDMIEVTTPMEKIFNISMVGWGLVTDIGVRAEKFRRLGTSRYTLASLLEVAHVDPRRAKLSLGANEWTDDFVFVIACNTRFTGKGMKIAPRAKLDDGLMDIVVVRWGPSRLKMLSLISHVYDGSYINNPHVEYYSAPSFSLAPSREEPLNMDGQLIGTTPIQGRIVPKAMKVYKFVQSSSGPPRR